MRKRYTLCCRVCLRYANAVAACAMRMRYARSTAQKARARRERAGAGGAAGAARAAMRGDAHAPRALAATPAIFFATAIAFDSRCFSFAAFRQITPIFATYALAIVMMPLLFFRLHLRLVFLSPAHSSSFFDACRYFRWRAVL